MFLSSSHAFFTDYYLFFCTFHCYSVLNKPGNDKKKKSANNHQQKSATPKPVVNKAKPAVAKPVTPFNPPDARSIVITINNTKPHTFAAAEVPKQPFANNKKKGAKKERVPVKVATKPANSTANGNKKKKAKKNKNSN